PSGDRAAGAAVLEIDIELRYLPDGFAAAVVDDNRRRPQPDLAQVGARVLLPARTGGGLGQDLDDIDAAEQAIVLPRRSGGWQGLRRPRRPARRYLRRPWRYRRRTGRELERERAVVGVEQHQARGCEVQALDCDTPIEQSRPAERHGHRGG